MAEREAYIDLVFRNGLKDLEVLPPQGVWEEIQPVVNHRNSLFFIRFAAGIAVLVSLGIAISFLNKQIEIKLPNPAITFNQDIIPSAGNAFVPNPAVQTILSNLTGKEVRTNQKIISDFKDYLDYKVIELRDLVNNENVNGSSLAINQEIKDKEEDSIPVIESKGFKIYNPFKRNDLIPSNNKSIEKWMIGATASPTYNLRFNPDKVNLTTQLQNSEENIVTYSGGFSFSYSINKKLSLQSGIYYSEIGNQVNGVDIYSGFGNYGNTKSSSNFGLLTTNGNIVTTNSDIYMSDNTGDRISSPYTIDVFDPLKANLRYLNGSIQQKFQYLEIPVIVRYKLLDKKIDINILGGISYNLLIGNSAFALSEGKHIFVGNTEGVNPLTFSSSLGLGIGYDLSKRISFNLEPTLRYYLSTTENRTDGKNHPYLFGVYSGVFYKF